MVLLAASCVGADTGGSPDPQPATQERTPNSSQIVSSVATIAVPPASLTAIDLISESGDFQRARRYLEYVQAVATYACLARVGYRIDVTAIVPAPVTEIGEPDLEQRATLGYQLAPKVATPVVAFDETEAASVALDNAMFGGPNDTVPIEADGGMVGYVRTGGCLGEALESLYGVATEGVGLFNLAMSSRNRSMRFMPESEQAPTAQRWSQCMAERGYSYQTSSEARVTLQSEYEKVGATPELTNIEIRTAVDDGECQVVSLLPTIRRAAAASYLESVSGAEASQIEAVLGQVNSALTRGQSVFQDAAQQIGKS
jgi:hypothetical protein